MRILRCMLLGWQVTDHRGHTNSTRYDMGVVIYSIVILVLTFKLMLETHYFTWINWFGFYGSVLTWCPSPFSSCPSPSVNVPSTQQSLPLDCPL